MKNIIRHNFNVTKKERNKRNKHNSFLIWFTGLSGSGKSTIANVLECMLVKKNISSYVLDGDNVRDGINNDLSFTPNDRSENIRRIAEISNLFIDAGVVTIACFISPLTTDRETVKNIVGKDNFIEIFINTSLKECENRDVKGLYARARSGEIKNMTGISAPYENPKEPDLEISTESEKIIDSVNRIFELIEKKIYE
jgi:adenylylsulfate kinase